MASDTKHSGKNIKCPYDSNVLVETLIKYKPKLITIANDVLHSHVQSEDVFQDAIVKACTMRSTCIHCPIGYACRMVYNLALDEARRRSHDKLKMTTIDDADTLPAANVSALDCIVATETLHEVLSSLKNLPRRTHEAFIRHRVEGIPQKDIAKELGVSRTLVNFMIKDAHRSCERTLRAA
ncbi:sigma-70 family RNA polymerase sigma factor [Phyllobacterium endophyticum]|nr:sigma-70 family RNA polymerase sigma factor [Phyllobacterium endophyticum]TXR48035.1 sigma-70 family RNA polymerase sigma factor [Phyllobacterium endophyticum]